VLDARAVFDRSAMCSMAMPIGIDEDAAVAIHLLLWDPKISGRRSLVQGAGL